MKKTRRLLCLAVIAVAGTSVAATVDWAASAVGNWTNGANWVGGSVPLAGDLAEFNGGNAVVTIDSNIGTINQTQMGDTGGLGTDTLNVETGGLVTFNQLRMASANAGNTTSILNINGGSATYVDGNTAIGYFGKGIVNVNSGSFSTGAVDDLDLGRNVGSQGELHVAGGTVTVGRDLLVAAFILSGSNTGIMDVSGGTVNIGNDLTIGMYGTGSVLLNGGSVTAGSVSVGGFANVGQSLSGTLTVDAGGLLTVGTLNVGGNGGVATGVVNLNGGTVHASDVNIGLNGILNLASAATLDTYANMDFSADGLLVWEGDHTAEVATMAGNGTFGWSGGLADYSDAKAFDQEFDTADGWLRSSFDGVNTEVWTVIPEPATLGLVAAMGAGMLFIRRRFTM